MFESVVIGFASIAVCSFELSIAISASGEELTYFSIIMMVVVL